MSRRRDRRSIRLKRHLVKVRRVAFAFLIFSIPIICILALTSFALMFFGHYLWVILGWVIGLIVGIDLCIIMEYNGIWKRYY